MVGLGDPAVANCLYVDCHDPEALAGMGSAEQRAGWSTGDLAADDRRWSKGGSNPRSLYVTHLAEQKLGAGIAS